MLFSEVDRRLIEAQVFDPKAEPSFEALKACLVWPDECPERISNEGREVLSDLLIVRGFIHRGVPREQWGLDPQFFLDRWAEAQAICLRWNGFRRMSLSESDSAYLMRSVGENL